LVQTNAAAFVGHFSQYNPAYQEKLAAVQHWHVSGSCYQDSMPDLVLRRAV